MQDRNDTIDIFFALCIYIEGKRKTNLSINHRRAWCILLSAWHVEIRKTHLRNEILKSILSGYMMTCPAPVTSISYWWWNCVFVAFGPHKRMGHIQTSKDSIFWLFKMTDISTRTYYKEEWLLSLTFWKLWEASQSSSLPKLIFVSVICYSSFFHTLCPAFKV